MQEARRAYAAVAHAIAEFEPVTLIVRPPDEKPARKLLGADVEILPMEIDDAWLRDSGPTFVVNNDGETAGVDWQFNAWGGKYPPWDKDDAVAGEILRHLSMPRYLAPLILEGGSFHADGRGKLLTTSQCLLHRNRNPRLSQKEIEILLGAYLGADEVLWLSGDERDAETDGHIDNIACFTAPGRALLMRGEDNARLAENRGRLTDAALELSITMLPRPDIVENGEDINASYINFYIANGGVIMPSFGLPQDAEARALIADEFPGRRVVQVPALNIVRGGGGIHCITQQQPKG